MSRKRGRAVVEATETWTVAVIESGLPGQVKLVALAYAHQLVRSDVVAVRRVAHLASTSADAVNRAMDALIVAGYMTRTNLLAEMLETDEEGVREDRVTLSMPSGELL